MPFLTLLGSILVGVTTAFAAVAPICKPKLQTSVIALHRNNDERLAVAERLLSIWRGQDVKLSEEQRTAILNAHAVGGERGLFTYSYTELLQKARILRAAGFSVRERRLLIEWGIAGDLDNDRLDQTSMRPLERELFAYNFEVLRRVQVRSEREVFLGNESPGLGEIDMRRIERFIAMRTWQLKVARAAEDTVGVGDLLFSRAKAYRERGEFNATLGQHRSAIEDLRLAVDDLRETHDLGALTAEADIISALRTVAMAGRRADTEFYNALIARLVEIRLGEGKEDGFSNLDFGFPSVNAAVVIHQRGTTWSAYREMREQNVRIDLMRAYFAATVGATWEQSIALRTRIDAMTAARDDIALIFQRRFEIEYGRIPSLRDQLSRIFEDRN